VIIVSVVVILGLSLLNMVINYISMVNAERNLYNYLQQVALDTYVYLEAAYNKTNSYTMYVGLLRITGTPTTYWLLVLNHTQIEQVSVEVYNATTRQYEATTSTTTATDKVYLLSNITGQYIPLAALKGEATVELYKIPYTLAGEPLSINVTVEALSPPKLTLVFLIEVAENYYEVQRLYIDLGG